MVFGALRSTELVVRDSRFETSAPRPPTWAFSMNATTNLTSICERRCRGKGLLAGDTVLGGRRPSPFSAEQPGRRHPPAGGSISSSAPMASLSSGSLPGRRVSGRPGGHRDVARGDRSARLHLGQLAHAGAGDAREQGLLNEKGMEWSVPFIVQRRTSIGTGRPGQPGLPPRRRRRPRSVSPPGRLQREEAPDLHQQLLLALRHPPLIQAGRLGRHVLVELGLPFGQHGADAPATIGRLPSAPCAARRD